MKKGDFFSNLENACPDDSEIERTNQICNLFDMKNGEELTGLYTKTDIILLVDIFEKLSNVSTEEYGVKIINCVSICSYTHQCGVKFTDIRLQTLQGKI